MNTFNKKRSACAAIALAVFTVLLGLTPAMASQASRPAQEVLACRAYSAAQAAKSQAGASAGLRSAAGYAAIAARADRSWRRVAQALNSVADVPDAMLTATQISAINRAEAIISSSCTGIGTPAISFGRSVALSSSLNSNTATAWTYFVGNTSLTAVQVAGLEGNLMYESGGLNPAAQQGGCALPPGPCGRGIAQWSDPGGRFSSLEALANAEKVSWETLPVQLQFVWQELTSNAGYGLAALQACTTTACATQVVEQDYERAGVPAMAARLADANELLAAYGESSTPTARQIIRNPGGTGYWLLSNQGGVYSYGGAPFYGSAAGQSYFNGQTAIAMTVDPAGTGYWIMSANGGIYSYGSAPFYGSAAGQSYFNGHIAASLADTADGGGYYILSTDGGVYSYGDAVYAGGGV